MTWLLRTLCLRVTTYLRLNLTFLFCSRLVEVPSVALKQEVHRLTVTLCETECLYFHLISWVFCLNDLVEQSQLTGHDIGLIIILILCNNKPNACVITVQQLLQIMISWIAEAINPVLLDSDRVYSWYIWPLTNLTIAHIQKKKTETTIW